MTCIAMAFRGGKLRGCADTRVVASRDIYSDSEDKLFRAQDFLFGYTGELVTCQIGVEAFIKHANKGRSPESFGLVWRKALLKHEIKPKSTSTMLIGCAERQLFFYVDSDGAVAVDTRELAAAGSGRDMALGAMLKGASPKKAIKLTSEWNTSVSPNTSELSIPL